MTARAALGALMVFGCSALAGAAPSPVQVSASADRTHVGLGKTVVMTYDVSYPSDVKVTLPPAESLAFPPFEVRDAVETTPSPLHARYTVRLSAYEDGPHTVPPLQLQYRTADGKLSEARSQPVQIDVTRSPGVAPLAKGVDIRDIKPMAAVPTPWWMTLTASGGLALVAGLAGWALMALWKRVNRARSRPKAPHALALAALDRLDAEHLPEKGQLKLHYDRLAEILRGYLARRFELPVLEHTTHEVVSMMEHRGFEESLCSRVGPVLAESDLVKFARMGVPLERAHAQVQVVRDIVTSTRPVEQRGTAR